MAYPHTLWFLSFTLPRAFGLVPSGRHQPCTNGCLVEAKKSVVRIEGPSREAVVEQAVRFVRVNSRKGFQAPPIPVCLAGPSGRYHGWISLDEDGAPVWGGSELAVETGRVA